MIASPLLYMSRFVSPTLAFICFTHSSTASWTFGSSPLPALRNASPMRHLPPSRSSLLVSKYFRAASSTFFTSGLSGVTPARTSPDKSTPANAAGNRQKVRQRAACRQFGTGICKAIHQIQEGLRVDGLASLLLHSEDWLGGRLLILQHHAHADHNHEAGLRSWLDNNESALAVKSDDYTPRIFRSQLTIKAVINMYPNQVAQVLTTMFLLERLREYSLYGICP